MNGMFYPTNGMYLHPCNDDTIGVMTAQEESNMENIWRTYVNEVTGTTMDISQTGKTFKTVTHYKATKHSEAESVTKKYQSLDAVMNKIKDYVIRVTL